MGLQDVYLVPHQPSWAAEFAREASTISEVLGEHLVEIHHIGSTAIPGIHAKPIIDLLAVVRDVRLFDAHGERLAALGYEALGEFGIAGRRYLRKNDHAGHRTHQIHAFASGSPQIDRHLDFRDFLKAHPDCAKAYDALKLRLAALYPSDISRYTDGKDDFIREMDTKAAIWRSEQAFK
jgi:GrpB-like predicted nucleotidyltransferase (UPF0157 family)